MSVERVGITVEVTGGQEALNLMRQLDTAVKRLNSRRVKINLSNGDSIVTATNNMNKLNSATERAEVKQRSLGDSMRSTFNRISSVTMHVGQQMQVLGKTLTQLSSPMRTLMRSTVFAGGFKLLNTMTEGLSRGFTRYDTMKKYPKIMQAFGYSSEEAQASIDKLDMSVRGLPTGLDEMVDMAQRFTATTGNITKGTDLAIAANNAFLASMSTDAQKYQGMMQLQDVLGGKDMTAKEWNSLVSSMTPAIVKMGEAMGYTNKNMDEWIQTVRDGKVSNEDFIKTLIKVGTGTGEVAKMAENSKDTWQAFFANIGNAASRMTAGLLSAFDEITQMVSGKDVNQLFADSIIPGIDNLTASLKGWIKSNPDLFIDFMKTIKSFDWAGLARGVGQGLQQTAKDIQKIMELFGGKGMEGFGRFMARAPMYGRILNIGGGLLKGLRGLIATLGTLASIPFIKSRMSSGGIFGIFGKIFGNTEQIKTATKSLEALPSFSTMLKSTAKSLLGAVTLFGNIALISGSGFVAFRAFKTMMNDLSDIVGTVKSIDWAVGKEVLYHMAAFFASFATIGGILAALPEVSGVIIGGEIILGAITTIASGILALDMHLIKGAMSDFKKLTESIADGLTNLSGIGEINVSKNTIKKAVDAMNEVYNMLKPQYQGQGIQNMSSKQAERMSTVIKNLTDVFKGITDIQKITQDINGIGDISSTTTDRIKNVFKQLGEIYKGISQNFANNTQVNFAQNVSKMVESTKKTFGSIMGENGIISQIAKIGEQVSSVTAIQGGRSLLSEAKSGLDNMFAALGEIYTSITSKFESKGGSTMRTSNASKIIGNVQEMFSSIVGENGIVAQMMNMGKALPKLVSGGVGGSESVASQVKSYLSDLFASLGEIYRSITSKEGLGMYTSVTKGSSGTANEILANVNQMFSSLVGKDGVIAKILELSSSLPKLVGGGEKSASSPLELVKGMIKDVFTAINEVYTFMNENTTLGDGGIGSFAESIGQLPQIMTSIQEAVAKIQEIGNVDFSEDGGVASVISQIQTMLSQLSAAFSAETIAILVAQVNGFKQTVTTLIESITSMQGMSEGNPIELSITFTHTITGADEAVSAIQAANNAIKSAVDSVQTSYYKTITITLAPVVNRLPMPSLSYGISTGGYVSDHGVLYRSSGGSVFGTIFKKRGSDTVPAMLTLGEYVHNKRAVDFFGIDFMRKINHLDVRGAIESLMSKAGAMAGINKQTVINNTYNNTINNTNNISTNSPDFATKIASRFAGAF